MKDVFLAFLGKTLNQPAESLAELLFKKSDDNILTDELSENALPELLRLDAERIQRVKPNTKEFFDNGYGKGKSETAAAFEKLMREKFGVDAEGKLQGEAIIDAVKAAAAGEGMKPDKVKTTPDYLALEAEMRKQIQDIKDQHAAELAQIQEGATREKTWSEVYADIVRTVKADERLNQEVITDPMLGLFASEFRNYDYQREGENFLPMKDGQRVENAQGYARMLSELVSERAVQVFPTQKQPAAGNAGNVNNGQGKAAVHTRFKDESDYLLQYNTEPDFDKKKAMYAAWEAQTQGN